MFAKKAPIEHLHVTSSMTSPTVAAILEVFFSHRAGRFNGNNVRKMSKIGHFSGPIGTFQCHHIKPEIRRDLKGIHLPSIKFSWKLKKLCRFYFFIFESWQTAVKSQGKTITSSAVYHDSKTKKIESTRFHLFPRKSK
jgi:hypothetical protein